MSIFINSKVHLPSSCEKCPFNYADMSAGVCTAADKTIDTRTYGRKRHPDCPMVELPTPHGRLIDADELMKKLERHRDMCGDIETQFGIDMAINILRNIPTIIEAEVSE
jgi:hypothetical protein